jgi:type I restriction enzyme S subunit
VELKPGYKQTEVGVIPSDWESDEIGNLADITTGGRNTQDRVEDGAYPFFVRSQKVEYIDSYSFDGEAVLTAGDGVGTGKVFHYINGKFDVHQRVYRITQFNERLEGYFFYLYFSNHFYNRIMQMTAKSSVDSVRMEMIAKMQMPLPPFPEQSAIATALSDVDALLAAQDELVAKKRAIKQGAMQELLTGKRRLPGFDGEWELRPLGALLESPVTDGPHLTPVFVDRGIPFLSVNNLIDGKIDWSDLRYISDADHREFSKKCRPQLGDILFGKAASVGKVAFVDTGIDFNIWSPIALIRINHQFCAKFVYHQLQSSSVEKQVLLLTNSSSQGNIGMSDIERLQVLLPNSRDEQFVVAAVLDDLDTEITALEAKRAKTAMLKQGMMQELLTGKTRLVPPLSGAM